MAFLLDPNELLLTLVGMWSAASAAQIVIRLRRGERRRDLLDVLFTVLLVLAGTALAMALARAWAGYAAALLWTVLVAFPLLASRIAFDRAARRDYRGAEVVTRLVAWLRPLGGWEDAPAFYRASRWLAEGKTDDALGLLAEIDRRGGALKGIAASERFIARGDWEGFRELVEQADTKDRRVPRNLLARYLRALGETGDLEAMLAAVDTDLERLWQNPSELQHAALFTFAFCGCVKELDALLVGPLRNLDRVSQQAWLATAEMANGDLERGTSRLRECLPHADAAQAVSIERRLARPPRLARELLSPLAASRLRRLIDAWDKAQRYLPGNAAPALPVTTLVLGLVILSVFAGEVALGGSMDQGVLLRMGAMSTDRVLEGEWWRVFSAQFLHMGPVHLVANLSGLLLVGGYVERRLGWWRYLCVYFASGTGPMLAHVLLAALEPTRAGHASIGASGCLMGLVGATAAILARGWFEDAVRPARRPLFTLAVLVGFQALLDIAIPIVDFLGHSLGVVIGFSVASLMIRMRWWRTLIVAVPGTAVSLLVTWLADQLPWRAPPCVDGELVNCEQSCDLGLVEACAELGERYAAGSGVERDTGRARTFLRRACREGREPSCALLRALEHHGGESPSTATALYRHACSAGSHAGCRALALSLVRGEGTPEDMLKGRSLLEAECNGGDLPSCDALGALIRQAP